MIDQVMCAPGFRGLINAQIAIACNDGLHAGLGIAPLRELQEYIRPGDVIIMSLEYQLFSSRDVMEVQLAPLFHSVIQIGFRWVS